MYFCPKVHPTVNVLRSILESATLLQIEQNQWSSNLKGRGFFGGVNVEINYVCADFIGDSI